MFPRIGRWEFALLFAVGLQLFGNRLSEVMRALHKGIIELMNGLRDGGPWAGT
jgi:Sec-independent protein translocase protein TatA